MKATQNGESEMIKLHLGSADTLLDGYVNCDMLDVSGAVVMDACDLSRFHNDTVDEILCHNLVEHLTYKQAARAFSEWRRVLKPDGKLVIGCPDILVLCKRFVDGTENERWGGLPVGTEQVRFGYALIQGIYGGQFGNADPQIFGLGSIPQLAMTHKSGWTPGYLINWLKLIGFKSFENRSGDAEVSVTAFK